jgi:coiled-coil domain-containing protein 55
MAGFGKMVIGQAGKKYGLQMKPGLSSKPKAASVFGDDEDDDGGGVQEDSLKGLASEKHRLLMARKAEKEMKKVLAEDSSIYDYDGALDDIHAKREAEEVNKKKASQVRGEVRYVHQLLKNTAERKKEDEKLFEKRLVKELQEEEEEFGQTEKFVTSAYKAQLLANKQNEAEQRRLDELKAKDDVRGKDSMSDFFANMLKGKNKASGAIVREEEAKPATTSTAAAAAAARGGEGQGEQDMMTLGDLPSEPLPPVTTDFASAKSAEGEGGGDDAGGGVGMAASLMPSRVEAGVAGETASEAQGAKVP